MTLTQLIAQYQASGGSLSGDILGNAADEVWAMMLSESRGRILEVEEEGPLGSLVLQCFRHMVEYAAGAGDSLQSETLGQWSRTYRDSGKRRDQQLLTILRQYLGETGLLYRGY